MQVIKTRRIRKIYQGSQFIWLSIGQGAFKLLREAVQKIYTRIEGLSPKEPYISHLNESSS
ncbi:hypothetical protein CEE35_00555 [Candidatus Aerophobetes bacterium Ae_b3b]|nr:MAG: hypothetical protein CEE35_00555 [Candidatus Aerophobetes bacterium Ae_b3b]